MDKFVAIIVLYGHHIQVLFKSLSLYHKWVYLSDFIR